MSFGISSAMRSSLRGNKELLKGRRSFNKRREMYLGTITNITASDNIKALNKDEFRKLQLEVRKQIRKRDKYNTVVLALSIILGIVLLIPLLYWLIAK